jgi:hypothetical protein
MLVASHALTTCRDVYEVTMKRVQRARADQPKRAAALAQIAEKCRRKGSRAECAILRGLNGAADQDGIFAKREAARRARRVAAQFTLSADRQRAFAFAAELEKQVDALELASQAADKVVAQIQGQEQDLATASEDPDQGKT